MLTNGVLRCDYDCDVAVTHIDTKGFVYCAGHGAARKAGGYQCRKLTASEVKALTRGETIAYAKPKGPSPKAAQKAAEALADRICSRALSESGKQINVLDIPKMHRAVLAAVVAGPDPEGRGRDAADAFIAALGDASLPAVTRALKVKETERAAVAAYHAEPVFPLRFRTHNIMRDGTEWTSPEAFDAPHAQYVAQQCIAGHLKGSQYWCTEEGTGRFLNGIGKDGNWITSSPLCASAVAPSGFDTTGRAVYYPAVRVHNPHPRLTYRRIRGSAHTLIAYDTRDASLGPEPVGWVLGEDVPAGAVVS